jgi:hypothetical protein
VLPVRRHNVIIVHDAADVLAATSIGPNGEAIALWTSPKGLAALTATTTQPGWASFPDPRASRPVAARVTVHRAGPETSVTIADLPLAHPTIQVLPDDRVLVVAARCRWRPDGPARNAIICDTDGRLVAEGTIGDGVEHALVSRSGQEVQPVQPNRPTVRKSQASIPAACARRNAVHRRPLRRGAGPRRCRRRIRRTDVADTLTPTLRHSPTIRIYPQRGFSRAIRSTRSTTLGSKPHWPRPVAGYVQRRPTSSRCQRSSVEGVTRKIRQRSPRQHPAQHGQHQPVVRGVPRSGDLPVQHHQLMLQQGDLDVLGIRCRTQPDQSKDPSDNDERERANHHDRQPAATCLRCSQP